MKLKLNRLALAALLCMIPWSAHADKISELPAGVALVGTEVAPFVQSGATVQITANQIATFVGALSQTPWVANINAGDFDLLNVDQAVIGHTAPITFRAATSDVESQFQILMSGGPTASFGMGTFSNDGTESRMIMGKSRGATIGSHAVVADGDTLGKIVAQGSDGTNFAWATAIEMQVDGTPGNNDMPGRLVFRTSEDNTESPDNQQWIHNDGSVLFTPGSAAGTGIVYAQDEFDNGTNTPYIQLMGVTQDKGSMALLTFTDDAAGPVFRFGKSDGAYSATPTYTAADSGDSTGRITFEGSDGTDLVESAAISSVLDGATGANDMPGSLAFSTTADGASSVSTRMTIKSDGGVIVGTGATSPGAGNIILSTVGSFIQTTPTTVGALPSCSSTLKGARAFVTDANSTTFHATAAGGGANNMSVVCDGTNWYLN